MSFHVLGVSQFTRSAAAGRPTFDPEDRAAERRERRKKARRPPWSKEFTRQRGDRFDQALAVERRASNP